MEHNNIRRKHSQGRRKIEIKKIEDESSRQTTFSKRRSGLFRKASELCLQCGAEAAIFVASPKGNKVYSYGYPSVEAVVNRYEHGEESPPSDEAAKSEFLDMQKGFEKLRVLEAKLKQAEMEKKNTHQDLFWWKKLDVESMGLQELEKCRDAIMELQSNLKMRIAEVNATEEKASSSESNFG